MVDYELSSTRRPADLKSAVKEKVRPIKRGICNPPITNEPEPITGDCKSPEHKEVRTFFDDGLQIRRNA